MGKIRIADHSELEAQLWRDMENGKPLLGAAELARAMGIHASTLQRYFNGHIVARVRRGHRFYSTKAAVLQSLKDNNLLEKTKPAPLHVPRGDWQTRQANAMAKLERCGITAEKLDKFRETIRGKA